jgi:predicted transcriptional regulator
MSIASICNRSPVTIDRSSDLAEAARLMRDQHVGYLVVTDMNRDGRVPVGVITDRDIVIKVVAKHVDAEMLTVGDAMTGEPVVAFETDDIGTTLRRMRSIGVRRLPVVDSRQRLIGVISLDDLIDQLAGQLVDAAGSIGYGQELEKQLDL